MEKKLIVLLLILFVVPFVLSADDITNYNVKSNIPLGQEATAYGLFQENEGEHGDVLCSFYLLDENNVLIERADDQYTDSLGYFVSKFIITEPDFKRGETYTYRAICGGALEDANFTVSQRETIAHTGSKEFDYLTQQENLDTLFIWGIFLIIFSVLLMVGYKIFKGAF